MIFRVFPGKDESRDLPPALTAAIPFVVSVLQGVFFALSSGTFPFKAAGVILALLNALVVIITLRKRALNFVEIVLLLWLAQFGLFVAQAATAPQPQLRLLVVALSIAYGGSWLAALLAAIRLMSPAGALRLIFVLGGVLLAAEAVLEFLPHAKSETAGSKSTLASTMVPRPGVGAVHPPGGTGSAYYRGNPQGHFQEDDPRRKNWWIRVAGRSAAQLVFPNPNVARVAITKAPAKTGSDIQINVPGFRVKANERYAVSVRARADQSRDIYVGFAKAHGAWDGLGLYARLALTTQWQNFDNTFVASSDDDNARIHFDLGGQDASVEIAAVELRSLPEHTSVRPVPPEGGFAVNYRFNAMSCRGPDYAVPKPAGTSRLLVLGNEYVLGEGVREEATVSQQLQQLLNARVTPPSGGNYEVINCGASGYGTLEQRQFYNQVGVRYRPDVVLAGVSWHDDRSFREEKERRAMESGPANDRPLLYTMKMLEDFWRRDPAPNFSRCVEDLCQLDKDVRGHGGRLVVFVFRNNADYSGSTESGKIWNRLIQTLAQGLRGTNISMLDLGQVLAQQNSTEDLKMHATIRFTPNEPAHRIAARELLRHLDRENVLRSPSGV